MKVIKYFSYFLLTLAIADCTKVTVTHSPAGKTVNQKKEIPVETPKPAQNNNIVNSNNQGREEHTQNEATPNIPRLTPDSNAIVKIDNLTPAVKSPGSNTPITKNNDRSSGLTKNISIIIENVVLTETGKSVMEEGSPAEAAIEPDYSGKEILLTITGKFNTTPDMKLNNMLFTNEPGLIHQSVVEDEIKIKVLIDDVILFSPVSASPTEIKVKIDSKGIPDFYLKGLHKLTILANEFFSDTLVRVGEPAAVSSLTPSISSVEVIKDSKNKPVNLKLTGYNFMLYYRYSYSQIDGKFGFGHQTNVIEESGESIWETIVHIPDIPDFESKTEHTISYATPFGFAFMRF